MPHQFHDGSEGRSGIDQPGGKGVAQDVRRNPAGDAGAPGSSGQDGLKSSDTLGGPARFFGRAGAVLGAALSAGWLEDFQGAGGQGRARRSIQGDDPGFVSLADVAGEMDSSEVGSGGGRREM